MKGLIELDCNESIWGECTYNLRNGWGNLENEQRFAFKTKNTRISEDDIESAFHEKFDTIDQIEVHRVYPEEAESRTCYFGVSMIVYESGIGENNVFC
jgi:hypothetical protein